MKEKFKKYIKDNQLFDKNEKIIVSQYLKLLRNLNIGDKIPDYIDNNFKLLAEKKIKNYPFQIYILLPAKRAFALWFNPITSLGFPGTFKNNLVYLRNLSIWIPLLLSIGQFYARQF